MNDLRERAEFWGVDPEPLIDAVESAMQGRRYWEGQKRINDAEPAECRHRLEKAHKAIAALPKRAREHLHGRLAERIAYGSPSFLSEQIHRMTLGQFDHGGHGPLSLNAEQFRCLMQDMDLVGMVLDTLSEPLDTEAEDVLEERRQLVRAWERAGGDVFDDDGRYDGDLIDFLTRAYRHLGDEIDEISARDTIRRRLDRRRDPLDSGG